MKKDFYIVKMTLDTAILSSLVYYQKQTKLPLATEQPITAFLFWTELCSVIYSLVVVVFEKRIIFSKLMKDVLCYF